MRRRLLLVAAVVGVGLGVFSTLADGVIPGRLFGLLGNIASPWGLAAFLVGRRTESSRQGALVGALALVVGVAVYFVAAVVRGYVIGETTLVWTVTALVAGPLLGLSGAAISARRSRPPAAAVVAPAAMLVAEAVFLLIDRRVWRWNLRAEPYRLIDLGVAVALLLGGSAFPFLFARDRRGRAVLCLVVAATGAGGAIAFLLLERLIVRVA